MILKSLNLPLGVAQNPTNYIKVAFSVKAIIIARKLL